MSRSARILVRSEALSHAAFSGERNTPSQSAAQPSPSSPVMMKDSRQPKSDTSHATSSAPTEGPASDPLIQVADARPRSERGAHSRITRLAPGLVGDSKTPSPSLANNNVIIVGANPPSIWNTDQHATAKPTVRRVPSRSVNAPAGSRQMM